MKTATSVTSGFPAQQHYGLSSGETLVLLALSGVIVGDRSWVDADTSVAVNTIANFDGTLNRSEVAVRQNSVHHRLLQIRTDQGKYLSVSMDEASFFCPPGDRVEVLVAQRVPKYHQEVGLSNQLRMEGEGDQVAYIRNVTRNTECSRGLNLVKAMQLGRRPGWKAKVAGVALAAALLAFWKGPLPLSLSLLGVVATLAIFLTILRAPSRVNLHSEVAAAVEQSKTLLGQGPVEFEVR